MGDKNAILETSTNLSCFEFWKAYRKRIIIATTLVSFIIVALVIIGLTAGVGGVAGGIVTALMLSVKGYGGKIVAGLLAFSISEIVGNAAPVFFKKITTPKLTLASIEGDDDSIVNLEAFNDEDEPKTPETDSTPKFVFKNDCNEDTEALNEDELEETANRFFS